MDSRIDRAMQRHDKNYNCAQAVACTYCDLFGVDEKTVFRMTEGLGLGMGGMEGTCGALSGACILAGLKNSTADLDHPSSKAATYVLSRNLVRRFEAETKATRCRDLKGIHTGVCLCSCPDCIRTAAGLVEELLLSDEDE